MEDEFVVVQIPRELHENLKIAGIRLRKTLKELVREIIVEYLGREGK